MAAPSVSSSSNAIPTDPATVAREKILQDYRKKLLEHKELEARLKESEFSVSCFTVAGISKSSSHCD